MTPQPLTARDLELIGRAVRAKLQRPPSSALGRREAPELRAALERLEALGGAIRHAGTDDPRTAHSEGIVGAPQDDEAPGPSVVDVRKAVLMGTVDVSAIELLSDGESTGTALAMTLGGRVNKSPDHVRLTFLFGEDGAAAIVTELLGLAHRIGPNAGAAIVDRIDRAIAAGGFGEHTRRTA